MNFLNQLKSQLNGQTNKSHSAFESLKSTLRKKFIPVLTAGAILGGGYYFANKSGDKQTYTMPVGGSLTELIKDSLQVEGKEKIYNADGTLNWVVMNKLVEMVVEDNNIGDTNKISADQEIQFDTSKIKQFLEGISSPHDVFSTGTDSIKHNDTSKDLTKTTLPQEELTKQESTIPSGPTSISDPSQITKPKREENSSSTASQNPDTSTPTPSNTMNHFTVLSMKNYKSVLDLLRSDKVAFDGKERVFTANGENRKIIPALLEHIRQYNHLKNINVVKPDQTIKIPNSELAKIVAKHLNGTDTKATSVSTVAKTPDTQIDKSVTTHTIQSGETVFSVLKSDKVFFTGRRRVLQDKELLDKVLEHIRQYNRLENINLVKSGQTIKIPNSELAKIVADYVAKATPVKAPANVSKTPDSVSQEVKEAVQNALSATSLSKNDTCVECVETIGERQYIPITSMEDFKEQAEKYGKVKDVQYYYVSRLWNDSNINNIFSTEFKKKKTERIYIPANIETRQSARLDIDAITKPDNILSSTLKGKRFVLDPGHGGMDLGAIVLAEIGIQKQKVVVYEAPIMMDIAYRVAKLLRSHGAEVIFTHYATQRPILNIKDLPPVMQNFVDGNEVFADQPLDIYLDAHNNSPWTSPDNLTLNKRLLFSNALQPDLFISLHADSDTRVDGTTKQPIKLLDILVHSKDTKANNLANKLLGTGLNQFHYTYNGNVANEVQYGVHHRDNLAVLKGKNPDILIELANMQNIYQAAYLRGHEYRQTLAESFVNAVVNVQQTKKVLGGVTQKEVLTKTVIKEKIKAQIAATKKQQASSTQKSVNGKVIKAVVDGKKYNGKKYIKKVVQKK